MGDEGDENNSIKDAILTYGLWNSSLPTEKIKCQTLMILEVCVPKEVKS